MIDCVLIRFRRRRAVSMIVGGAIILALLLTVLGTMVYVSQQYDQYQQLANRMAQYHQQQGLENLVANYPGLTANPAWSGCGGCNMYDMSLSNLGGVGVQIVAIYITSTGSGCTSLCVLRPSSSSTSYAYQPSTQFLNAGEINHAVLLFLPSTVTLPGSVPGSNTVLIVTSRGNEFSFEWPFLVQVGGQSTSAFSAGTMKAAYTCYPSGTNCGVGLGYDSSYEPGLGGTGTSATGYCHYESATSTVTNQRPQKFTGISVGGTLVPSEAGAGNMWFVNSWLTTQIFCTAAVNTTGGGINCATETSTSSADNETTLYLYVNVTNTGTTPYSPVAGSLDLTWYGSNHIDGTWIGMYYNNAFVAPNAASPPSVPCATCGSSSPDFFYGIFRVTQLELDVGSGGTWPPPGGGNVFFFGSLSLTNNLITGFSTTTTPFVGGTALSSGLWIRTSC